MTAISLFWAQTSCPALSLEWAIESDIQAGFVSYVPDWVSELLPWHEIPSFLGSIDEYCKTQSNINCRECSKTLIRSVCNPFTTAKSPSILYVISLSRKSANFDKWSFQHSGFSYLTYHRAIRFHKGRYKNGHEVTHTSVG